MLGYSVIVPAFNCADVLENTINSILHAGLHDFEIIIVDDGSTDGTDRVCGALSETHGCVRSIRQENAGVSAARNRGIDEAKGEYILFVDADDSLEAGSMAEPMRIAETYRPDLLIFGQTVDFYRNGRIYRRDILGYRESGKLSRDEWRAKFEELHASNSLSPVWNKLYRRRLIAENGIRFDPRVFEMEDFLFVSDCLKYCGSIWSCPVTVYHYRQTEDEKNTVNRLARIVSLPKYMEPFERSISALELPCGSRIVNGIYFTFLAQRISAADLKGIAKAVDDCLGSRYCDELERRSGRSRFFRRIKKRKVFMLWLGARYSALRHKLGILVKRMKSGKSNGFD